MKRLLLIVVGLACFSPCAWAQKTSQLTPASNLGDTNIVNVTQGPPGSYTSNGATMAQVKNYVLSGPINGSAITSATIPATALTFSLATVATSGSYNDLINKPTIPAGQINSDWNASSGLALILNKPTLATVATSGSYTDLTGKPTIPAAQVNSDWKAASGVPQILNRPVSGTVVIAQGPGNDFVTVSGLGLSYTPSYVFVVVRKSNANGGNIYATVRGGTLTTDGFTVDLSSYVGPDSYTYNLDYFIIP